MKCDMDTYVTATLILQPLIFKLIEAKFGAKVHLPMLYASNNFIISKINASVAI